MLFHEIYGCYYNAVAKILGAAVKGGLTDEKMKAICDDNAFSESFLEIIPALKGEKWQLLRGDHTTPLKAAPELPPTTLELMWLKAITLDPRLKLFDVNTDFLRDIEPLFRPEDIVITDKYLDGDPFCDPEYIKNFRELLKAVKNGNKAHVLYETARTEREGIVTPYLFEYSEREDKLRCYVHGGRLGNIIALSRVKNAVCLDETGDIPHSRPTDNKETAVLEVSDERTAVERALLHFAHYEKKTEIYNGGCRITLHYSKADRAELAGQILSFGPLIKVTEPPELAELIKDRLLAQLRLSDK